MSESADKGSKTEEATEKKKRDSMEKGNVPFSREAPIFASLLAMLIVSSLLISGGTGRLVITLQRMLDDPGGWSLENGADAIQLLNVLALEAASFLAAPILVLALAGVASSLLQNPPSLALKRITPDMSRISPSKGWGRIFGVQG